MKASYLRDETGPISEANPTGKWPAGTVIDRPDAYKLVLMGVCSPADDECTEKCGMTPADVEAKAKRYRRTAAGIAPDDFQAYADGLLTGYNPDGSWIDGPNAEQHRLDEQIADTDIYTGEDE